MSIVPDSIIHSRIKLQEILNIFDWDLKAFDLLAVLEVILLCRVCDVRHFICESTLLSIPKTGNSIRYPLLTILNPLSVLFQHINTFLDDYRICYFKCLKCNFTTTTT